MSRLSPEEIEKDIEFERAELAVNLSRLQESVSLDALVEKGTTYARTHARDAGQVVLEQVKRNPIPMALIGAGLAWLAFGGGKSRDARPAAVAPRPAYAPVSRDRATESDYRTVPADAAAARIDDTPRNPDWMADDPEDRTPAQPQWVPADDVWTQPGDNK